MQTEEKELVQSVAAETARIMGAEILDIRWIGSGRAQSVRLIVDQDGGVSTETCVNISREFDLEWEARTEKPRDFTLEVTSPGPDRPLRTARDFSRVAGKWVEVHRVLGTGTETLTGKVISCTEDVLSLTAEGGNAPCAGERENHVDIPLAEISNAKILFVIGNQTPKGKTARRPERR